MSASNLVPSDAGLTLSVKNLGLSRDRSGNLFDSRLISTPHKAGRRLARYMGKTPLMKQEIKTGYVIGI